jgi:hypothetical protein
MTPVSSGGDYNAIDFLCQQIFLSAKHKNKCLKNDGYLPKEVYIIPDYEIDKEDMSYVISTEGRNL